MLHPRKKLIGGKSSFPAHELGKEMDLWVGVLVGMEVEGMLAR